MLEHVRTVRCRFFVDFFLESPKNVFQVVKRLKLCPSLWHRLESTQFSLRVVWLAGRIHCSARGRSATDVCKAWFQQSQPGVH